MRLNNLCWEKATHDVALDMALAECDAALKGAPDGANTLDSRAFVLLRMGRVPEAIQTYDQALKRAPKQAASLYGRGLARLRAGRRVEGEADIAAAKAIAPGVAADFAEYGLTA